MASGALWFAALNALLLFRAVPGDPATAGRLAAAAFSASYWICALVVLIALVSAPCGRWLGALAGVALLLQLGAVVPALTAHGAGWPGSFASLHATASSVHFALALVTLVWAVRLARWQRLSLVRGAALELP